MLNTITVTPSPALKPEVYNVFIDIYYKGVMRFLVAISDSLPDPGRSVGRSVSRSVCLSVGLSAICAFLRICLESLEMTWKCFRMLKNVMLDLLCARMHAHWPQMCT